MAKVTMEVALSDDLKRRIEECAAIQGKSIQVFVQEALYTFVEDVEDGVLSSVALSENGLEFYSGRRGDEVDLADRVLEISRKTA